MGDQEISNAFCLFDRLTKKPQEYLSSQENITDKVKELVKNLYDVTKHSENKTVLGNALPELIINSFDEEQIWQELELQNNDWNNHFVLDVSQLVVKKANMLFPIKGNDIEDKDAVHSTINREEGEETVNIKEDDYIDGSNSNSNPNSETDDGFGSDNGEFMGKKQVSDKHKASEVDDTFFKLGEMEMFLEAEDRKETSEHKYDDDDGSGMDYFLDEPEDIYPIENKKDVADYKYSDFFAPPENVNDKDLDDYQVSHTEKHVRFNFNDSEGVESSDDENNNTDNKDNFDDYSMNDSEVTNKKDQTKETKSSFEERQERLQRKIKNLEQAALSEKPWQLWGEVGGTARPQNSLLEEVVDFDLMTRPAPLITEETTMRLEDIIICRIKDKAWDDVERKVKPVETTETFKKGFVLDQEKSKLSLAEIYEQEYVKKRDSVSEKQDRNLEKKEVEPELHTQVRTMMITLFNKLDALSNFHYTPRPAVPELKVVSNVAAINMEEVAPIATTNAMLLTPEEIQGKRKGQLINKSERTATDKKRALRIKKNKQKKRKREREKVEKIVSKINPGMGNKYSKQKAEKEVNDVLSKKNVTQIDELSNRVNHSSKNFFSKLQDEVSSNVKVKAKCFVKKKKKSLISAANLKL